MALSLHLEGVEEEVQGKIYDSRLTRRLLAYMWPYRRMVGSVAGTARHQLAVAGRRSAADEDRHRPLLWPRAGTTISTPLDSWLAADPWTGLAQVSLLYLAVIVPDSVLRLRTDVPDAVDRARTPCSICGAS